MWTTVTDERELRKAKEEAAYYQRQYEEELSASERRTNEERQTAEQRRRQRDAEWEENYRTASNWPEALAKQAVLFGREVHLEDDTDPTEDHWFSTGQRACYKAVTLWRVEEAIMAPQIAALQAQIDALDRGIAAKVADALAAEDDSRGAQAVINALRDPSLDLTNWLNW